MSAGPSMVRPSLELDRAVERMRRQNLTTLPVTTSGGRLLGLLERDTAKQALRKLNRNSARTLSEDSPP
jgi:predicted transcriptional regulator